MNGLRRNEMLKKDNIGKTFLITTDCWFIAPDGQQYKGVFGTLKDICSDEATLGIKTNRGSTNWYVEIGNMCIAGCQVHYVVQTDSIVLTPTESRSEEEDTEGSGKMNKLSLIYNADEVK